jgi:lipoprotein-anchoring transpeptidase ErfK/SrfK
LSKGLLTKVTAALLVLVLATFSTARAHQLWSTQQAQATVKAARARADIALTHARQAGLTASELAGSRHRVAALDAQSAPAGSPIWNAAAPDFYARQQNEYDLAATDIRRLVTTAAATAQHTLDVDITSLAASISSAGALDVSTVGALSTLSAAKKIETDSAASIPRLRAAAAETIHADKTLKATVTAQQAKIASIENAARDDVSTLVAQAQSAASAAEAELHIVELAKPNDAALATSLQTALSSVSASTTLSAAALADMHFNGVLDAANTAIAKDLPAKMVVVSTETQEATMYENGKVVYSTPVTTGGPELPTFHGAFHIFEKISPFVFHSPFPVGSPYYYDPTPVDYWMPFDGQQGLHDASWRPNFGPGSNLSPTDLGNGNTILGTHGCVNLPADAAAYLWSWAPLGTTVVVN